MADDREAVRHALNMLCELRSAITDLTRSLIEDAQLPSDQQKPIMVALKEAWRHEHKLRAALAAGSADGGER